MKLYKVYNEKLYSVDVLKKTKCFYFLKERVDAFGFSSRIDGKDALLTPQEAIQNALNNRKTMQGVFQDKLIKIENELKWLETLQKEYNKSLHLGSNGSAVLDNSGMSDLVKGDV